MRCFWPLTLLLFCALLAPALPLAAQGDAADWSLVPIETQPTLGDDGVDVQFYFTLRDRRGQVVPQNLADIASVAQIQMSTGPDTAPREVTVAPAETPISIMLLIDTSGSMTNRIEAVIAGAQEAVTIAPPATLFSVAHFSRLDLAEPLPVLDRRQRSPDAVRSVLASLAGKPGGETCLYNATYKALEFLKQEQEQAGQRNERRAVILFTDGRDELGDGSGQPCSTRTKDQVIERALADYTPIHTVALCNSPARQGEPPDCGGVDRDILAQLASDTAGFSAFGDINTITEQFQTIMAGISAQWVVSGRVLAARGMNRGTIIVRSDAREDLLTGEFSFISERDYGLAPTLRLRDPAYDSDAKHWNLTVELENPRPVAQLEVSVLRGGVLIEGPTRIQVIDEGQSRLVVPLSVPGAKFRPGEEHCFTVRALNQDDSPVIVVSDATSAHAGRHELAEQRCIKFVPDVRFEVLKVEARHDLGRLQADLLVEGGGDEQLNIRGQLFDQAGVQVSNFQPILVAPGEPYSQDMPRLLREQAGQYELRLSLTVDNQQFSHGLTFRNDPPRREIPWALFAMFVFALGIVAASMTVVYRQRQIRREPLPLPRPIRDTEPKPVQQQGRQPGLQPETRLPDEPPPSKAPPITRARIRIVKFPTGAQPRSPEELVTEFPCIIGRAGKVLILGDKNVSREHAVLDLVDGALTLTDQSSHGTFIDGRQLDGGRAIALTRSTRVGLGPSTEIEIRPETA